MVRALEFGVCLLAGPRSQATMSSGALQGAGPQLGHGGAEEFVKQWHVASQQQRATQDEDAGLAGLSSCQCA